MSNIIQIYGGAKMYIKCILAFMMVWVMVAQATGQSSYYINISVGTIYNSTTTNRNVAVDSYNAGGATITLQKSEYINGVWSAFTNTSFTSANWQTGYDGSVYYKYWNVAFNDNIRYRAYAYPGNYLYSNVVGGGGNRITSTSYTAGGIVVGSSRAYFDETGKAIQSQTKNLTENKVLTSQPIYDQYNRVAIQTLPAPINGNTFTYQEHFVTKSNGSDYTYTDFDVANPATIVGLGSQTGTLGHYYSNNSIEANNAADAYPFSLIDYYDDGTGEVKSSSQPGATFIKSLDKRSYSKTFPVMNELDAYMAISNFLTGNVVNSLRGAAVKTVARDQNGKESVSYTDENGNVLAVAYAHLTGAGIVTWNQTLTYNSSMNLSYLDIHVPTVHSVISNNNLVGVTVDNLITGTNVQGEVGSGFYRAYAPRNNFSYSLTYYNPSFNFYDNYGRLILSVPPRGVKKLLDGTYLVTNRTTALAIPYSTRYYYDFQGRLIKTVELEAGETNYIYRKDGSIRFSQNAKQAINNCFSYTNYDQLGRPVESGEYKGPVFKFNKNDGATAPDRIKLLSILELTTEDHPGGGLIQQPSDRKDWVYTFYDLVDANRGIPYQSQAIVPSDIQLSAFEAEQPSIAATNSVVLLPGFQTGGSAFEARIVPSPSQSTNVTITFPSAQSFVQGAVSFTENEHSKTWYSYDDQGRVSWMATWYKSLFQDAKWVEYEYDFLGNVTNIKYQRGKEDAFYHRYVYDADMRLSKVYAGKSYPANDLVASYIYYLHGPLKKVVFGKGVESMEYYYTLQGQLKSINNPNTSNNAFAQTYAYYSGDYSRSGVSLPVVSPAEPQYNGIIGATHAKTDYGTGPHELIYHYRYDDSYQLTQADDNTVSTKYRVSGITYDPHGNIQTLTRRDESGQVRNQLAYTYDADKINQLKTVVDNNGTDNYDVNYSAYSPIGELLTMQRQSDPAWNFDYDVTGKVKSISDGAAKFDYEYDDRGFRIRKVNHDQPNNTSVYVRDASGNVMAVYAKDNDGQLKAIEYSVYGTSRIGTYQVNTANTFDRLYELKDHLGNVRAVVQDLSVNGLEIRRSFEDGQGLSYVDVDYGDFSTVQKHTGQKSWRVRNSDTFLEIPMSAGDHLDVSVWIYKMSGSNPNLSIQVPGSAAYHNATTSVVGSWTQVSLGDLTATQAGNALIFLGEGNNVHSYFDDLYIKHDLANSESTTYAPVYFNDFESGGQLMGGVGVVNADEYNSCCQNLKVTDAEDFVTFDVVYGEEVDAEVWVYHSSAANAWDNTYLEASSFMSDNIREVTNDHSNTWKPIYLDNMIAGSTGTVTLYLGASGGLAYFDDLIVYRKPRILTDGEVINATNYYPFGLSMNLLNSEKYRYGYQGEFSEEDEETGFNHFEAREHDPVIGRWMVMDPARQYSSGYLGMGNNPVNGVDPDGRLCCGENQGPGEGIANEYLGGWNRFLDESATFFKGMFMGFGEVSGIDANAVTVLVKGYDLNGKYSMSEAEAVSSIAKGLTFNLALGVLGEFFAASRAVKATKTGMTDLQLVTRAAQKAEIAIGGTGRFAGIAKHTYANNLLSRYQSIYGNRGFQFNQYFNGPAGRGFLDVVNHQTMTIYDYKFGSAVMGNSQFLKYSNSFPGYGIQIIRPF